MFGSYTKGMKSFERVFYSKWGFVGGLGGLLVFDSLALMPYVDGRTWWRIFPMVIVIGISVWGLFLIRFCMQLRRDIRCGLCEMTGECALALAVLFAVGAVIPAYFPFWLIGVLVSLCEKIFCNVER